MAVVREDAVLSAFKRWLPGCADIPSAVLFGSLAREAGHPAVADQWSDVDLHLIVKSRRSVENIAWKSVFDDLNLEISAVRAATGQARKVTLVFAEGEADLVLIPQSHMRIARIGMRLGLHRRNGPLADALNAMATIMGGGYRFLKGECQWAPFYHRVVTEMPGVRIDDREARRLADVFLCDLLWVLKKNQRGEGVAALRVLHRSLIETNIILLHELRLRRRQPTFQQARRVEKLLRPDERNAVAVSARLETDDLRRAAFSALAGLQFVMQRLVPAWEIPSSIAVQLAACDERTTRS